MTNREWLESLSDDELAKVLNDISARKCWLCVPNETLYEDGEEDCDYDCESGIWAWLKSKHEE